MLGRKLENRGIYDTLMATVPTSPNRATLVFRRDRGEQTWVRLRTFNRHLEKGVWYPTQRFYVIAQEHAEELGAGIIDATLGVQHAEPGWYREFENQYLAMQSR